MKPEFTADDIRRLTEYHERQIEAYKSVAKANLDVIRLSLEKEEMLAGVVRAWLVADRGDEEEMSRLVELGRDALNGKEHPQPLSDTTKTKR